MDGVLVDTGELHYRAWEQVLGQEGIHFSPDEFRRTFGMHNASILEILLGALARSRDAGGASAIKKKPAFER